MKDQEQIIACGESFAFFPVMRAVFLGVSLISLVCLFFRLTSFPWILIWGMAGLLFLGPYRSAREAPLTITDRRLYGRTLWGKKVEISLDSVSRCSLAVFYGLKIHTPQRTYYFPLLKNQCTLYNFLAALTRRT